MPLLDHFGLLAPFYERFIPPSQQDDGLLQRLGLPVAGRVLDAAGGTGRVAQALRGQASQVVVADESSKMLRQALKHTGLQAARVCAEQLPFPDQAFDRIIMVDALHHVGAQGEAAGELWRVLAQGGRLIIEEPDVHKLVVKFVALGEKLLLMRSHFLKPQHIAGLFPDPQARVRVEQEGWTAYVIVEKDPDAKPGSGRKPVQNAESF